MSDISPQEEINRWHRRFAMESNNKAWDLIDEPTLTPEEKEVLVHLAHTAAYHWSVVGAPINGERADLTLAYAYAAAGNGEMAMTYAQKALSFVNEGSGDDWDLAFAHCGAGTGGSCPWR